MMRTPTRKAKTLIAMATLAGTALVTGCGENLYAAEGEQGIVDRQELAQALAPPTSPSETPAPEPIAVPTDEAFPEAFDFSATDLSGTSVSGDAIFADKPAIVAFVTPWCPVCRTEGGELADIAARSDDVDIIVVHSAGSTEEFKSYRDELALTGENVSHINDADGELWRRFGVVSQPTYLLIDSDGLLRQSVGGLEQHGLERAVALVRS